MAGTAVCPELAVMLVPRSVAGKAVGGRAGIPSIDVTGGAGHSGMTPCERKTCRLVIEIDIGPTTCRMAGGTDRPELPQVLVLRGMARVTIPRSAFIDPIRVACRTEDVGMQTRQREGCSAVIERNIIPLCGLVAGSTVFSKLAFVDIP
jgi:hypothetical protein